MTASDDKTAKAWSAASGVCLLTLEGHKGSVHSDRIPRGAREGAPVIGVATGSRVATVVRTKTKTQA